jgi:hypothetical protein
MPFWLWKYRWRQPRICLKNLLQPSQPLGAAYAVGQEDLLLKVETGRFEPVRVTVAEVFRKPLRVT